ncbi:ABC transporter permease [Brevibacillus panacihumi]|uniref:ABC transporter permease n=1 Tax=Brevibacillus panacihumi TaxID=497735 RepID=UPI003D046EF2
MRSDDRRLHPFWVIVQKEVADHLNSWRFYILLLLLVLTCFGSLYTAMMSIRDAAPSEDALVSHLFLKLFTVSDGTLPAFMTFIAFLGPLLGIGMGFDAINSERTKGTLSRLLAQPIHRDYVLHAKFVAALLVISVMFFALGFLVMGLGLVMLGIPPAAEEFWRMVIFLLLSICYVAFWLNLAILFSVRFRQAATSALASIAVWIFFSVFFTMIVRLITTATLPSQEADMNGWLSHQQFVQVLMRFSPSQLFSEATTIMLTPSIRSLGPLTMEQIYGAIPSPLPLGQSVLLIWPHIIGLLAATTVCFGLSYLLFMRQEIRSR